MCLAALTPILYQAAGLAAAGAVLKGGPFREARLADSATLTQPTTRQPIIARSPNAAVIAYQAAAEAAGMAKPDAAKAAADAREGFVATFLAQERSPLFSLDTHDTEAFIQKSTPEQIALALAGLPRQACHLNSNLNPNPGPGRAAPTRHAISLQP